MFFTTRKNLFRQLFTTKLAKGIFCGIAALNILAGPGLVSAGNRAGQAAEYDEWGLDYPGATPAPAGTPPLETSGDADRPAAQSPAPTSSAPVGGTVPQDIAESIEQVAVHVIVFYADGNHMRMPGWIVDTERRIIMTFGLLKDATKVHIGYPQAPTDDPDSMEGSEAVILSYDSNMDVAYLQAKSMPSQLANLTVSSGSQGYPAPQGPVVSHKPTTPVTPTPPTPPTHNGGGFNGGQTGGGFNGGGQNGGFQRPAQQTNPLVGQWYLQDEVNGQQIQIAVVFNAQGQFALEMLMVDGYGQQNQYSNSGTYTVQGSTLTLNSNEGVEQSNFWFENGLLNVRMVADGTTLTFQPAS